MTMQISLLWTVDADLCHISLGTRSLNYDTNQTSSSSCARMVYRQNNETHGELQAAPCFSHHPFVCEYGNARELASSYAGKIDAFLRCQLTFTKIPIKYPKRYSCQIAAEPFSGKSPPMRPLVVCFILFPDWIRFDCEEAGDFGVLLPVFITAKESQHYVSYFFKFIFYI